MKCDATKHWILDASDELAVRNGCWFDPLVGAYAVWWVERHCRLYEGRYAGTPLVLRGRWDDAIDAWPVPDQFDERLALERHEHFVEALAKGEQTDWQYPAVMRLYGWQRFDEEIRRNVRRFRRASWWVPKKNKKSPTLAALALYTSFGDGEPGNKVALCAKDGSQARKIAGEHVLQMVRSSPELSEACKINLNEYQVTFLPTQSIVVPFSSSNARTQESKEGFNGSIFVDETHVVDRAFMRRLSRAGISRDEPIQLEVSTAGTNPDGYGKEQHDYGAEVAAGTAENDALLFIAYEADQQINPDGLSDADIIRLGKQANPAWGHTIRERELLADWHDSQRKLGDTLDFMMYRLNVWQQSSSPWLRPGVWQECYDPECTIEHLRGRPCVVGFDKSDSRDFSAFVALFPEWGDEGIETIAMLPWIIAPSAYVRTKRDLAPFADWVDSGHLIESEGDVISVGELYSVFGEIADAFDVQVLAYDAHKAESITQIISQGASNNDGEKLSEGYGVERVKVNQKSGLLEAIGEFEALATDGRIRHGGNLVMDWMLGNVHVKNSTYGKRLEKADGKDGARKIDGVMAALTGLAIALDFEYRPMKSVYESRGLRDL